MNILSNIYELSIERIKLLELNSNFKTQYLKEKYYQILLNNQLFYRYKREKYSNKLKIELFFTHKKKTLFINNKINEILIEKNNKVIIKQPFYIQYRYDLKDRDSILIHKYKDHYKLHIYKYYYFNYDKLLHKYRQYSIERKIIKLRFYINKENYCYYYKVYSSYKKSISILKYTFIYYNNFYHFFI